MRVGGIPAPAVAGAVGAAAPAAASDDTLLPHPGPEGLVWVPEWTGDGGVASGGAWDELPTVLTVACRGGGSVAFSMDSQQGRVADFSVDCPADRVSVGWVTMDPGSSSRARSPSAWTPRRTPPLVPDGDPTRIGPAGPRLPAPRAPAAAARRRDRRPPGGPPMYR
ncbi:hypothetical protein GCM10010233_61770 [Streptomyces pseudogriseolus]|nr:hypothetical protein GCM10010233_61770 [Streptomyces gancidicus]